MGEEDWVRLVEITETLRVTQTRAIILGINFLHSLMRRSLPEKEKDYSDIVLPSSPPLQKEEKSEITNPILKKILEDELPVKKKGGWPKGKPRGKKRVPDEKPVLRIVK